jgi:hypothetical protein
MNELLLCALRRIGRPAIASDITDAAVGLALDAGWPRNHYEGRTAKHVAAALRAMEAKGMVRRAGGERVNGNDRQLWEPADGTYDATAAVPLPPAPARRHALEGRSQAQAFTMFDAMDELAVLGQKHLHDLAAFTERQITEYKAAAARVRSRLATVGLPNDEDEG